MEPFDGKCERDHDTLILLKQKVEDNSVRIDVHRQQIMGIYASIAAAFGFVLIIIYQFVVPPLIDKDKSILERHQVIENRLSKIEELSKEISLTNERINRLYELYRDMQQQEQNRRTK